jgi:hypothetical protein
MSLTMRAQAAEIYDASWEGFNCSGFATTILLYSMRRMYESHDQE